MSDFDYDAEYDYVDEDQEYDIPELRKAYQKQVKKLKAVEEENVKLKEFQRSTVVTDVVKEAGFNPAIASFIPNTISDPDAVKQWLGENGSLFAGAQGGVTSESSGGNTGPVSDDAKQGQQFYSADEVNDAEKFATITPTGGAGGAKNVVDDIAARIEAATTREELDEIYSSIELK